MRLVTERLDLVPADGELARCDLEDPQRFAQQLGARIPPSWPPELLAEAREPLAAMMEKDPGLTGWMLWYWLLREQADASAANFDFTLIGVGGFKGRPSAAGMIEVGYALLPEFQRAGLGSEGLRALLAWGFSHREVHRITAETLPGLTGSIRLLKKAGFQPALEPATERGAIRFDLARERYRGDG